VAPLTLDDEDLALLQRAAVKGSPVARGALGLDGDIDEETCLAWRCYFLAARRMGHLDLERRVTPALETCPACGPRAYVEHASGIGETVSSSPGPRNELGHTGDEHHAWVLLMLCIVCGHEGEILVDTGDPIYG
jgi:hypothetical protein